MPTNVFFSPKVNTEQYMFEDIIIESIKMYGQDVFYMPRKIVQRDTILGEDVESEFNTANTIEMFIENTEGFEGEGNIFQKFGMEIRDEATFIVAKRSWQKLVGVWNSDINDDRPREGDLIYLPLSKSFFEISYVEHEQPFYQLSNLPVFKLQARLFEFNEEEFNTGISELDSIENDFGKVCLYSISTEDEVNELGRKDTVFSNQVCISKSPILYIPKAFTPDNGDIKNDIWNIAINQSESIDSYKLQVFSRWGQLMFESNSLEEGWDGTFANNYAPNGMYIFDIQIQFAQGQNLRETGRIVLLR